MSELSDDYQMTEDPEEQKRRPVLGIIFFITAVVLLLIGWLLFSNKPAAPAPSPTPTSTETQESTDELDEPAADDPVPTVTNTPTDTPQPPAPAATTPASGGGSVPVVTTVPPITETPVELVGGTLVPSSDDEGRRELREVWDCRFVRRDLGGNEYFEWYTVELIFDENGVQIGEEVISGPHSGYWQSGCPLAPPVVTDAPETETPVTPEDEKEEEVTEEPEPEPDPEPEEPVCNLSPTRCTYGIDYDTCTCIIG